MISLPFNWKLSLPSIQLMLISAYYVFNFIDRGISNIFLLLVLLLCLIDYKRLYEHMKDQWVLVIAIILFTAWVTIIGAYHESPMHELDNYYRFIFLMPLLIISIKDQQLILILYICAFGAFGHLFWTYTDGDIGRYRGTSSNAITYANLCALFFILCIYFYFIKKIILFIYYCLD